MSFHLIKVDVDGANIGGTNSSHAEEAVTPTSTVDSSLIEVEETLQPTSHAWIHAEQFTCRMRTVTKISDPSSK